MTVSENEEEQAVWGECQNSEEIISAEIECCPFGIALRRGRVL